MLPPPIPTTAGPVGQQGQQQQAHPQPRPLYPTINPVNLQQYYPPQNIPNQLPPIQNQPFQQNYNNYPQQSQFNNYQQPIQQPHPQTVQQPQIQQQPPPHPPQNYPNYPIYPPAAAQLNQPQSQQQQFQQQNNLSQSLGGLSITSSGFNRLWGSDHVDLLKHRHQVLPPYGVKAPEIRHTNEFWRDKNVAGDIFRCTLTKIPESKTLLQKSRLPLGILIHPFKDLTQLPVVQCSTIVRCRSCRTYINPFVYFIDNRRWKCNLCFRVNDLPDEFQYDPLTKTYGDPHRRPEILSGTIEFLAPADYMVRPPQAAVYLFVLEVTPSALESGYLKIVCDCLAENLGSLPGDSRTQIGFITYGGGGGVQFYNLAGSNGVVGMMSVVDVEEVFIPLPDGLLVKLDEYEDNIRAFLRDLPGVFMKQQQSSNTGSCLGAAVSVAQKMLAPLGGRLTLFVHTLPTLGPGSLHPRDSKTTNTLQKDLSPSTDFYKKIALDCSGQYIAVDIFFTGNNYTDIASISCISRYSGGCIVRVSNLENPAKKILLENAFVRYLTRKIGFEAVMRVRCSRGLSIHTFHGNLFVRSTDLLSLPNCNPDAGFGMQVSIDEDLRDFQHVAFQAALLYTSSKGERRIRVHTLCLPVASNINDVILSADQQAIIGLLAKMGVDRALTSSLQDAREAFVNAVVDILSAYGTTQNAVSGQSGTLIAPANILQMLPVYVHGLLRSVGFRQDLKPSLDDRAHFFNQLKSLPLYLLIQSIYPDLYRIDQVLVTALAEHEAPEDDQETMSDIELPLFPLLTLGSDRIDAAGVYLLDQPESILVYVCRNVGREFCAEVLGVQGFAFLNEMNSLPDLPTTSSTRIRNFVNYLQGLKPFPVPVRVVREDSRERTTFTSALIEDRDTASVPSYYEFLQQIQNLVK